jgi:hypothetical protein
MGLKSQGQPRDFLVNLPLFRFSESVKRRFYSPACMKILVNPWSSWSFRKKRSISLCQLTSSIIIRCCLGLQRCGTWYLGYGRPTSGIIGMSRLQWIDDHLLLRENKQCFGHAHIVSLSSYPAKIIFNMITYIYIIIYICNSYVFKKKNWAPRRSQKSESYYSYYSWLPNVPNQAVGWESTRRNAPAAMIRWPARTAMLSLAQSKEE